MNDLVMNRDISDHETLSPVVNLSPAHEARAVASDVDEAFAHVDDTLWETEESYPMGDLVEKLRARFDWSWDIIDVLSDEQLQVLAFTVKNAPR